MTPNALTGSCHRSSIGAGLRDIKERGIEAHTEDLVRELEELRGGER